MNYLEYKTKQSLKLLVIPFACAILCGSAYAGPNSDASGVADQEAQNVAGTHAQQTVNAADLSNKFSQSELENDTQLLEDIQNGGGVISLANSGISPSVVAANSGANADGTPADGTGAEETEDKPKEIDPKEDLNGFIQQYFDETKKIEAELDKANIDKDIDAIKKLGPEYKQRMYTLDRIGKDLKTHNPDYDGKFDGNYENLYKSHIQGNNYTSSTMQVLTDAPITPDKDVLLSVGFPGNEVEEGGSEDATDETSGTADPDTGDGTDDGSTQEGDAEAGIEAVCGGNFGGKNGAKAMLEKIQSAECQAALEADPALKAEASVDQAIAGLGKWQSVVNGSSKYFLTIQGIGIENLRKIGVNIWPNYTQAEIDMNFADASKAVEAQQDVKNQSAVGDSQAATEDGPKGSTDKLTNIGAAQ